MKLIGNNPPRNSKKKNRKLVDLFSKKIASFNASNTKDGLDASTTHPVVLQRNIDFLSCLGLSFGTVIGSGIFISPKGVLIGSGSIGASLIVWVLCGVKALLGSLAYAELGTRLPNSGGAYYYLLEAFHPNRKSIRSFWGSLPFLYFWYDVFFSRPAAFAVHGIAVSQYAIKLTSLSGCGSTFSEINSTIFTKLITLFYIFTITAANCYSNKLSTMLIKILTSAKLLAISFIIISGITMLSLGRNEALKTGFEGTSIDGLVMAYYSGAIAFSGWSRITGVARELVNPKRDLPRCLISSCLIITVIYLLVNIAYYTVLSKEAFLASDAVAADFAYQIIGKAGIVLILSSVILSIFGSSLGASFAAHRTPFAAAREGHMVEVLSFIHHERMIPSVSVLFTGALTILMMGFTSVLTLISLISFTSSLFFILTMVALLVLKKREKCNKDVFQVPLVVVFINIITDSVLVVIPFINPKIEFIMVVGFLSSGLVVYTIFVYYRVTFYGFDKVTKAVQKIMMVVPPEDDDV